MAAGKKADRELFDDLLLADDDLAEFFREPAIDLAEFIDRGDIILRER